jgi:hypothetical protein
VLKVPLGGPPNGGVPTALKFHRSELAPSLPAAPLVPDVP